MPNDALGSGANAPATLRSLIVAPQWIGDAIMSEPLLRRLAQRGERLTVGALPWVAPAYRAMACVAEVQEWPLQHGRLDLGLRWRLGRALAGRFDRAYVLPNSLKAALLPWFAGIPERIGYLGEGRRGLLNRWQRHPGGRPAMVDFYAALAEWTLPAGAPPAASDAGTPSLQPPPGALAAVCQRLGLQPGRYRVFAPGAEYGPAKCWPAGHYAALARQLLARDELPLLIIGSAKEAEVCEAIAAEALAGLLASAPGSAPTPPRCRSLAGQTSLAEAIALLSGARALVSNDSGLMHVAAAFGIEQVALFGSTSPLHTPPLNPQARVLWLKDELALDCMPCFERRCRFGHLRCLTDITPDRVAEAVSVWPRGSRVPQLAEAPQPLP